MNILVMYGTYSGSTMAAAQQIEEVLKQKNHTVTVKDVMEAQISDLTSYDFVFLATCSWLEDDKDGQPHKGYLILSQSLAGQSLENHSYAILGIGDSTYLHFCGGADVLQQMIQQAKGNVVGQVLKVDQFYANEPENREAIVTWTNQILSLLGG